MFFLFDSEGFAKRLVALLAENQVPRRGAGAYLARKYKVSTVTANAWLNGAHRPEPDTARKIAEDHGSDFEHLYFGAEAPQAHEDAAIARSRRGLSEPSLESDYVRVPRVAGAHLSAGNGTVNWDIEEIDKSHAFRREWMQQHNLRAENCKLFEVKGQSMEPTINHGDLVLLNFASTEVQSGEIYAVMTADGIRIKRLFKRDGAIWMLSDNADKRRFPDEPVQHEASKVIARAVWRAGAL